MNYWPELLVVSRQHDIRELISNTLDRQHDFGLRGLTGFIAENVTEVAPFKPEVSRNPAGKTGRHYNAVLSQIPHHREHKGQVVVYRGKLHKVFGEILVFTRKRIESEELCRSERNEIPSDEIRCRVARCTGENAGLRIPKK
jgi:hypothetical protein